MTELPAETPPVEAQPSETPPETTAITSPTSNEAATETASEGTLIGEGAPETEEASFGIEEVTAEALAIPEGVELSEEQSSEFLDLVNSAESKADLASKMLDMYANVQTELATKNADAWATAQAEWRAEIEADPEYGGDKMPASLGRANELVTQYGDADFTSALNLTGMGNNVHFLRFLMKMGGDLPQQASPVTGSPAAGSKSLADRLFSS